MGLRICSFKNDHNKKICYLQNKSDIIRSRSSLTGNFLAQRFTKVYLDSYQYIKVAKTEIDQVRI